MFSARAAGPQSWGSTLSPASPTNAAALPHQAEGATGQSTGQAASEVPVARDPWRLNTALGMPEWLSLSGHVRARYETFTNQFRAGFSGNGDAVLLRTSLRADARFAPGEATLEILDSRLLIEADADTPINTTIVNPLEILQAYLGLRGEDIVAEGNRGFLLAGRHTMNVGSRRLISRNRFRNTINSFTGINATLDSTEGQHVRAFFALPVRRRLAEPDDPDDGNIKIDDETSDVRFWGLFASSEELLPGLSGEIYYYDLDETDEADLPTRNRRLSTAGLRVFRRPRPGEFDFEVEGVYQFGTSRATSADTDTTDLDHRAHFEHAEMGYSFHGAWKPRVVVQFDYASGDDDPNDGENNRFDTLFGSRRGELGPTSIFGPFSRSNLVTPGVRLFLEPTANTDVMFADRFYYLASETDAWVGTGVRDPSGQSGNHLGNLVELRWRWRPVPDNLTFDTGGAYLFKGSFAQDAPNATGEGDSTFLYAQLTFTF